MFDSLADRTREAHGKGTERVVFLTIVLAISAVVFGGLYFAVQHLQ